MAFIKFDAGTDWKPVGRFTDISHVRDGQREFLEAIPRFRHAQATGSVPKDGFLMPDVDSVFVGRIVDLAVIPHSDPYERVATVGVGMLAVKEAPRQYASSQQ